MEIDQKLFLTVRLNSDETYPCSPKEPGDPRFLGILINAPRQVKFKRGVRVGKYGAFAAIPLCGYSILPVSPGAEDMLFVAVDRRTGATFSGRLRELDLGDPIIPPPKYSSPSPEELKAKGLAAGGYFNPNLADFVELPEAPAVYDVHIEFTTYRSNTVTIEIVEE